MSTLWTTEVDQIAPNSFVLRLHGMAIGIFYTREDAEAIQAIVECGDDRAMLDRFASIMAFIERITVIHHHEK